MAMHKIQDDNGVHYLNDKEYRHFKVKGCLMTAFGVIAFIVLLMIL